MALQSANKRKSDQLNDEPTTPAGSPVKRLKITVVQKQALIDNLQLEITERARHLRAHYALQCEDLRARIRRRINRVPIKMRSMTVGEILAQQEKTEAKAVQPPIQKIAPPAIPARSPNRAPAKTRVSSNKSPEKSLPALPQPVKSQSPIRIPVAQPTRQRKRKSSDIHIVSDKENTEPDTASVTASDRQPSTNLAIPKNTKRARPATAEIKRVPSKTNVKVAQAKHQVNGVLSPRSHNSRTLPRSPLKDAPLPLSPTKSPVRPTSPFKATSPFKFAANAATSALSSLARAGSKLTRPLSRGKDAQSEISKSTNPSQTDLVTDQNTLSNTSPLKMAPPPKPAHRTLPSKLPISPYRTTSQTSNHTTTSTTSSSTVITKLNATKKLTVSKSIAPKATARTAVKVSQTRTKSVLSPKTNSSNAGIRKVTATKVAVTAAVAAKKNAATGRIVTGTATTGTGRVLRKRN